MASRAILVDSMEKIVKNYIIEGETEEGNRELM